MRGLAQWRVKAGNVKAGTRDAAQDPSFGCTVCVFTHVCHKWLTDLLDLWFWQICSWRNSSSSPSTQQTTVQTCGFGMLMIPSSSGNTGGRNSASSWNTSTGFTATSNSQWNKKVMAAFLFLTLRCSDRRTEPFPAVYTASPRTRTGTCTALPSTTPRSSPQSTAPS